jgi:uncharacterized protein YjbI with pentapeptide repeats
MTTLTRELLLQIIKSARAYGEKPTLLGANLAETRSLRAKARESILNEAEIRRATLSGAEHFRLDLRRMDLNGVELIIVAGNSCFLVWLYPTNKTAGRR